MPDRAALDGVAPDHAVVLRRVDGHLWVVGVQRELDARARTEVQA